MKSYTLSILAAVMLMSACVQPAQTSRSSMTIQNTVSSDATQSDLLAQPAAGKNAVVALLPHYDVQAVTVVVPTSLVVSEANSFKPRADIVWHGDPMGNRYEQVKAIFDDAMTRGTAGLKDGVAVLVEVQVTKFHCLTEKTRYTIGGMHDMEFMLTVRDAATGSILQGPRLVNASVKAAGGNRAIAEDAAGRTQKVVVTERLAEVIGRELTAPIMIDPSNMPVTQLDNAPAAVFAAAEGQY